MQEHRYSFEIDAPPEVLWGMMNPRMPEPEGYVGRGEFGPYVRKIEYDLVNIEILHEGDEHGSGLVRHCYFRVPKYLLSGGMAQSWEHVTEVVPGESLKYYTINKPPWGRAEGEQSLEPLPDGRTRVHFVERFHLFNPIMRLLFEKRVHRFISKDNDKLVQAGYEDGVKMMQAGAAGG